MKKWVLGFIAMFVLALAGYSQRATIAERLLTAALPQQMATNQVAALANGLHVVLCGAGGPMPAPRASGPCVGVVAGKQLFIVDTGTDGTRNLQRLGYPPGAVEAVFLTHFHSDHIDGLGELAPSGLRAIGEVWCVVGKPRLAVFGHRVGRRNVGAHEWPPRRACDTSPLSFANSGSKRIALR